MIMAETFEKYPLEHGSELLWDNTGVVIRDAELQEQRKQVLNSLKKTDKGGVASTYENYEIVLRCDPLLKGAIRLNELTGRNDIVREMWWPRTSPAFDDLDMNYLLLYIEKYYGLGSDKSWIAR